MRALWIASGIAVWAVHFTVIYGLAAYACARGGLSTGLPWGIGIATVLAVLAAFGIIARSYGRRSEFIDWMAAGVAGFALLAIVYEGMSILWFPGCGSDS